MGTTIMYAHTIGAKYRVAYLTYMKHIRVYSLILPTMHTL